MTRFETKRRDGTWGKPRGIAGTMGTARRRLVPGAGPFNVVRLTAEGGKYAHKGLHRSRALKLLEAILENISVDAAVYVQNRKGLQVIQVRRVAPDPVYSNPLRDCIGLKGLRIDQGVDYSVTSDSPVYAIGPGVVTIYRPVSGWPLDASHSSGGAYIAYRLTEGPQKGLYVYDAEHITLSPVLKVGSSVGIHTPIATHHASFANCEMGWASPSNDGYSPLALIEGGGYTEGQRTAAGDNFDGFMQALGAPSGLTEGRRITGKVPTGYP